MDNVKELAGEIGKGALDLIGTGASWFYGGASIGLAIACGCAGFEFGGKVVRKIGSLFSDKDDEEDEA